MTDLSSRTIVGCGATSALLLTVGMPGHFGWWPLLFIALVPLLMLCLRLPPLRSGLAGLAIGFVYHLALIYWVVVAVGRYGGLPLFLAVGALVLLALYMSCYWALFCFLLSRFTGRWWQRERSIAGLVWFAPVLWVALDSLRSMLFSGFPWMDLGYGLYSQPVLIQAADLGGHHTVTFALVLCNSLVVAIIDRQRSDVRWNIRGERRMLLLAGGCLVFLFGYSFLRYDIVQLATVRGLQARVTAVQGNIDQAEKWTPGKKAATVATYVRLSEKELSAGDVELVVWPETALPFYLQRSPLASGVARFVHENNVWLLTGAPTYARGPSTGEDDGQVNYYNAALLLDTDGRVTGHYRKQHLVPFGEYVPLKKYLPFLSPLVVSVGNFSAGTSSLPLTMGTIRMGVLICFESIFPEIARASVAQGANLLVNLTNDAWYGRSSAPHQSMAMAVFRAVETRRSLVRAANTGISAFVDPAGNITRRSELFVPAALTEQVSLWEEKTVFSRAGHLFGLCCLCGVAALVVMYRRQG